MSESRRSYGTGSLFVRVDAGGREHGYVKWLFSDGGRQFKRRLGPKRTPGTLRGKLRFALLDEAGDGRRGQCTPRRLPGVHEDCLGLPSELCPVGASGSRLAAALLAINRPPSRRGVGAYGTTTRVLGAGDSLDAHADPAQGVGARIVVRMTMDDASRDAAESFLREQGVASVGQSVGVGPMGHGVHAIVRMHSFLRDDEFEDDRPAPARVPRARGRSDRHDRRRPCLSVRRARRWAPRGAQRARRAGPRRDVALDEAPVISVLHHDVEVVAAPDRGGPGCRSASGPSCSAAVTCAYAVVRQ